MYRTQRLQIAPQYIPGPLKGLLRPDSGLEVRTIMVLGAAGTVPLGPDTSSLRIQGFKTISFLASGTEFLKFKVSGSSGSMAGATIYKREEGCPPSVLVLVASPPTHWLEDAFLQ